MAFIDLNLCDMNVFQNIPHFCVPPVPFSSLSYKLDQNLACLWVFFGAHHISNASPVLPTPCKRGGGYWGEAAGSAGAFSREHEGTGGVTVCMNISSSLRTIIWCSS